MVHFNDELRGVAYVPQGLCRQQLERAAALIRAGQATRLFIIVPHDPSESGSIEALP